MTAREYFEGVSDAVRSHRRAELALAFGPEPSGFGGGPADPASGGPTASRALANERARSEMEQAERAIGEGLARIEELRRIFSRKADAVELRYVDLLPWAQVAEELGVDKRTAMRWRDELFDWVDSFGWARLRLGMGTAEA